MSNGVSARVIGPGETGIRLAARAARSLRVNFAWNFCGSAVYAACQWGMLIVLAKIGTPEMLGQFALALAITAPVIMLLNLQLSAIQATDAARKYDFGHYFGLRILTTAVAGAIIAQIALTGAYDDPTRWVILIVGATKLVESISDILYGAMQQRERLDLVAVGNILKGPLSLLALSAVILATNDLVPATIALLAVWVAVLVLVDFQNTVDVLNCKHKRYGTSLRPRFQLKLLASLAWQAAPLGVVMMLISLNYNIPRYIIAHEYGPRELGIFAALAYILVAANMVLNTLGQTASPRLARYLAEGNRPAAQSLLLRLLSLSVMLGLAGIVIAATFGEKLLTVLYRREFAEHADVLLWLMIAASISHVAAILGFFMTAARHFTVQLPLFAAVCVASTFSCMMLIPHYGLRGLAMGMAVGFVVQLIGSAVVVIKTIYKIAPVSYEVTL